MDHFNRKEGRNYWLHRETYEGDIALPLLSKGFLCYGWKFLAERKDLLKGVRYNQPQAWYGIEEIIKKEFGYLPRNRFCLLNFIKLMKSDDWVVVPKPGEFAVYRIVDDTVYSTSDIPDSIITELNIKVKKDKAGFFLRDNDASVDIGLVRKVEKVLDFSSKERFMSGPLFRRMKYQMANISLNDLTDQLIVSMNRAKSKTDYSLRCEIDKTVPNYLKSTFKDYLEPGRFEHLVEWYFKRLGAKTDIPSKNFPGKKGGEDIDIRAQIDALKTVYYVQVKFHEGESGCEALDQAKQAKETGLYQKEDDYASVYWALTSADSFSEQTKNQQKQLKDEGIYVRLINGVEFLKMLLDIGFDGIDDAFK